MQEMKIAVIVPLMAPEIAKDWSYVQFCLNRTLASVLASSGVDFRIYVICQSRPEQMMQDARIEFLQAENPLPNPEDKDEKRNDKGLKIMMGVRKAAEYKPDYIMRIDADDLLSRHLFEYVAQTPGYDAFFVNRGYEWQEGSSIISTRRHFHQYCGTCFISRYGADLYPYWIGYATSGERICDQSHTAIEQVLREKKYKLHYINQPMVVYITGGNDQLRNRNLSIRRRVINVVCGLWRKSRISQKLRDEFSLT